MQLPLLFLQPCLPDGGTGDAGTSALAWSKLDSKVLALRVLSYRTKLWEEASKCRDALFGNQCCNS